MTCIGCFNFTDYLTNHWQEIKDWHSRYKNWKLHHCSNTYGRERIHILEVAILLSIHVYTNRGCVFNTHGIILMNVIFNDWRPSKNKPSEINLNVLCIYLFKYTVTCVLKIRRIEVPDSFVTCVHTCIYIHVKQWPVVYMYIGEARENSERTWEQQTLLATCPSSSNKGNRGMKSHFSTSAAASSITCTTGLANTRIITRF